MLQLILGLFSLLALHWIVVRGRAPAWGVMLSMMAGFVMMVGAIDVWLSPPRFLPDASSSTLTVRIAEDLRTALSASGRSEIVLIDGGSYVARGVDAHRLGSRLNEKMGRRFKIVFLAIPGGNQSERRVLLHDAVRLLTPEERSRLRDAKVTILLEIHEPYDKRPFAQLSKNPRSDRAYGYVRPGVVWEAVEAGLGSMNTKERNSLVQNVLALAVVNAFNVGASTRMTRPHSIQPISTRQTLRRKDKSFHFKGLEDVIAAARERRGSAMTFPEMKIRNRREFITNEIGAADVKIIYFSVPSTRVEHLRYAQGFCSRYLSEVDGCISHGHNRLLLRLNHKRYWYDAGHLLDKGAAQYTRWLADRLALQMSDEKRKAKR